MMISNNKLILSGVLLFIVMFADAQLPHDFWGRHAPGITDSIPIYSDEKILYLTLDACDRRFDRSVISLLRKNNISATLFLTARWIDANPVAFKDLAADNLFKIANHGTRHKPASISGMSAYNIKGTTSREELIAEINDTANKIEALTGVCPDWYRSGTAWYDAGAIEIITNELGLKIAGFAKDLDAGASFSAKQIYRTALTARPGDILLTHMNRPESEITAGLAHALPELIRRGFVFKQLP